MGGPGCFKINARVAVMSKKELFIVKLGGKILDDEAALNLFIHEMAASGKSFVLVHGGGNSATRLAEQLNISQTMIEGRRVTDEVTLDLALMCYAGLLNKKLVANLQSKGINALGLSGADGNSLRANMKSKVPIDFGFVGVPQTEGVNIGLLKSLLENQITPVFCAITHDGKGQLLNTNADTLAQVLAIALSGEFMVKLVYLFDKKGVLTRVEDESSLISSIQCSEISQLKESGIISEGMIPKLENACLAISQGVNGVIIGHPKSIAQILENNFQSVTHVHS